MYPHMYTHMQPHMCPMMQSPCWHCMMLGKPMEHCPMLEEMKKYEYEMKKKVKIKRDEEDDVWSDDSMERTDKKPEINIINIINVEAPEIMSSLKAVGIPEETCKRIIIRIAELAHKHMR